MTNWKHYGSEERTLESAPDYIPLPSMETMLATKISRSPRCWRISRMGEGALSNQQSAFSPEAFWSKGSVA